VAPLYFIWKNPNLSRMIVSQTHACSNRISMANPVAQIRVPEEMYCAVNMHGVSKAVSSRPHPCLTTLADHASLINSTSTASSSVTVLLPAYVSIPTLETLTAFHRESGWGYRLWSMRPARSVTWHQLYLIGGCGCDHIPACQEQQATVWATSSVSMVSWVGALSGAGGTGMLTFNVKLSTW